MHRVLLTLLATGVLVVPAAAQEPPDDRTFQMVGGGLLLGVLGWYGGVLLAAPDIEEDNLTGAIIASAVGGTLGMAAGIHLGNRRRGNLGKDFLAGMGVWTAGALLLVATDWSFDTPGGNIALIMIPIAQFATVIPVEVRAGRHRQAQVKLNMGAAPHGRVTLGVTVGF